MHVHNYVNNFMEILIFTANIFVIRMSLCAANDKRPTLSQSDLLVALTHEDRYNRYLIPHFETDVPINVTVNIKVISIGELSAEKMEYSVGMYLRLIWLDERLNFENILENNTYKEFSNITDLDVHPNFLSRIWQPDPAFTNFKNGRLQQLLTPSKMLRIFKNGTVLFSTMLSLRLSCPMDLRLYPMDIQICHIEFESFGYRDKNIKFVWNENNAIDIDENDVIMPQFALLTHLTCASDCRRVLTTGNFTCLRVEFYFKRSYGYHLLQIYLPSILIVVLSWVSFWISPDAIPGRVTVGVTSVLTMTTQSSGAREDLPPVSYVKAIDVWMTVCLSFVFAALLEFAYVNTLREYEKKKQLSNRPINQEAEDIYEYDNDSKHRDESVDEPAQPEHIKMSNLYQVKANEPSVTKTLRPNKPSRRRTTDISCSNIQNLLGHKNSSRVDNLAKIIFPLTFIIFNTVYWIFYLNWRILDMECGNPYIK